jgi:hypothetical protein
MFAHNSATVDVDRISQEKNMNTITKRVAVYKDVIYGFDAVFHSELHMPNEYTRITEFVDVEFTQLPDDVILAGKINALDEAIKKEQSVVFNLQEQKRKLLALTHGVSND